MRRVIRPRALTLALLAALAGASVRAASAQAALGGEEPDGDALVSASLVLDPGAFVAGSTATVGVRLVMEPEWHIYWRNPGEAGLEPTVRLTLPPGFRAGAIAWPAPTRYVVEGIVSFIYEGEVTLLVPVEVPADAAPGAVDVAVEVDWLVCRADACLPGSGRATRSVPVVRGAPAAASPADGAAVARARAALPAARAPAGLAHRWDGTRLVLELAGARRLELFPYEPAALAPLDAHACAADAARLLVAWPEALRGQRLRAVLRVVPREGPPTVHEVELPGP